MKTNYFEILELPVKLVIDPNLLKKNYFNLLKQNSNDPVLDPDGTKPDDVHQKKLIEEAYQTLRDRITRIEHVLELKGLEVANDNKAPSSFADLAGQVEAVLSAPEQNLSKLKELHRDVLTEFSSLSIELSRLETSWDDGDDSPSILRKLRRKSAAFSYIRGVEQDLRSALGQ